MSDAVWCWRSLLRRHGQRTAYAAQARRGRWPGVRTLDALHLAAAQRVAEPGLRFLTFDRRQGLAARQLGLEVVPA